MHGSTPRSGALLVAGPFQGPDRVVRKYPRRVATLAHRRTNKMNASTSRCNRNRAPPFPRDDR
jgi:hypothetical protein